VGLNKTLDNPAQDLKELLPLLSGYMTDQLTRKKKGVTGKVDTIAMEVVTVDEEGKPLTISTPIYKFRDPSQAYTNKYMKKLEQFVDPATGKTLWRLKESTTKKLIGDIREKDE
jgi:hypothetical protein